MKNYPSNLYHITDKEYQTWRHLSEGLTYKEIASQQFVTVDTIKKHLKNLYKKLSARNRTEAVTIYMSAQINGQDKKLAET